LGTVGEVGYGRITLWLEKLVWEDNTMVEEVGYGRMTLWLEKLGMGG